MQGEKESCKNCAQLQDKLQQVQPTGGGASIGQEVQVSLGGSESGLQPAQPWGEGDGVSPPVPEQRGRDASLHQRQHQRHFIHWQAQETGQGWNHPGAEGQVRPAPPPVLAQHGLPALLYVSTTSTPQVWRQEEEATIAITAWELSLISREEQIK